jgi:non-canonical purine NTP pyrophosphatase (RdgB/HAM1 family)
MAILKPEGLFFATGNTSKFDEYRDLLSLPEMKWISLKIPQEAETDITLLAESKLRYVRAEIDKYPFFVEECGLSIPAWNNLPGALSSNFIHQLGCDLFCRMMSDFQGNERFAKITKVIHYMKSSRSRVMTFSGQILGVISTEPRGKSGFGWDQIFVPNLPAGNSQTMAELGPEAKNRLLSGSDPACAFREFLVSQTPKPRSDDREDVRRKGGPASRTILILASNPRSTEPLRLDQEVKKIEQALERARNRDQFRLVQKWAVTDDELRRALLDYQPEIVHFAGHGTGKGQSGSGRDLVPPENVETGGLVFEDDSGQAQIISRDALARLFELCASHVKCVLLNACYSEVQAEAIARHVDNVVGMQQAIGDDAAIKFAVGFYDALWAGHNFETAYKFGRGAIDLKGIPEHLTPVFHKKPNQG